MKNLIFAVITCICSIFLSIAHAAIVTSLYQANVPVASQSQDNWQNAMPSALTQVLVKVSGDPQVAQIDKIKNQLPQASALVQSYTYIKNQNGQNNNLILQVQFDSRSINNMLRQAGIPLWSKQRPTTLIWLAVQTPRGQTLVSNNPTNPYAMVLQNAANQRGIPILLPIMDLQDMQNVSLTNILQLDPTSAMNTAKRYGANETLIGHVYLGNDGKWHGKVLLALTGNNSPWEIEGNDPNQVLTAIIDKTATTLTANVDNNENFAPAQKQTLSLHITNVNGLGDYADVVKYLRSLPPVTAVDVVNVNPNDINVNVDVLGGVQAFNEAISGGTQMQALTPPTPQQPNTSAQPQTTVTTQPAAATNVQATAGTQLPTTAATTQPVAIDDQSSELDYRWLGSQNNIANTVANTP